MPVSIKFDEIPHLSSISEGISAKPWLRLKPVTIENLLSVNFYAQRGCKTQKRVVTQFYPACVGLHAGLAFNKYNKNFFAAFHMLPNNFLVGLNGYLTDGFIAVLLCLYGYNYLNYFNLTPKC